MAGERAGRLCAERARAEAPTATPEDLVVGIIAILEARGLGRLEVADLDAAAGTGTLRLKRSPYADTLSGRDRPACHSLMGLWAGLLGVVGGRDVAAEEVHCRAMGDPACEIVAAPRRD